MLKSTILKIAIILIIIAVIIQAIHIPSDHNSPISDMLQNSDISNVLSIIQYIIAIIGISLIIKFVIDKIFTKK